MITFLLKSFGLTILKTFNFCQKCKADIVARYFKDNKQKDGFVQWLPNKMYRAGVVIVSRISW